jgi:hypothetical protein
MKTDNKLPEKENIETKKDGNDCLISCSPSSVPKNDSQDEDEEVEDDLVPRKTQLLIILGLTLTIPLVLIAIGTYILTGIFG